jgi:hypothetical protein
MGPESHFQANSGQIGAKSELRGPYIRIKVKSGQNWLKNHFLAFLAISWSGPLNSGGCPYRPLMAGSRGEMPTGGPGPSEGGTPFS